MALPWLIGAVAVALGTAVVAAINSDNDTGDGGDDEEHRRKAKAEKERKERALKEKKDNIKKAVVKDFLLSADALQQSLEGKIISTFHLDKARNRIIDVFFNNGEELKGTIRYCVEEHGLQFLTEETQSNLKMLQVCFDAELKPDQAIIDVGNRLKEIESSLAQLKKMRERLQVSIN